MPLNSSSRIHCIWLGFLALMWAPVLAYSAPDPSNQQKPTAAYEVLGVPTDATAEQIAAAHRKFQSNGGLTPAEEMREQAAFAMLSNDVLRSQYDQGVSASQMMVNVSPDQLEQLAKMMEEVDPKKASLLRRTGKVTVEQLSNMATFYFAVGLQQAAQSFKTRDPLYFKNYLKSLDPTTVDGLMGHVGFISFVGSSHVINRGAIRLLGDTASNRVLSNYLGLVSGSLTSELISDTTPGMKAYYESFWIKDPKLREEKRKEARKLIYDHTFGDPNWLASKSSHAVSLVLASVASEYSRKAVSGLFTQGAVLAKGAKAKIEAEYPDSMAARCTLPFLQAAGFVMSGEMLNKLPQFAQHGSNEVSNLLVFLAWSEILKKPVESMVDSLTLEASLKASRPVALAAAQGKSDSSLSKYGEVTQSSLEQTAALWDEFRRRKMHDLEPVMSMHLAEMNHFDREVSRPYLFYKFLADGQKPGSFAWQVIRETFYTKETKPQDIQREIDGYLRAYFCGPEPGSAFKDSWDFHGIPIPGHASVSVEPYRAASGERNPELCDTRYQSKNIERLKAEFAKKDRSSEIEAAQDKVLESSRPIRIKRIQFYEKRVQDEAVKVIEGEGDEPRNATSLPKSILASFNAEFEDLRILRNHTRNPLTMKIITDQMAKVKMKRESAENLLLYYKAPLDQRKPPTEDFISQFLDAATAGEGKKPDPTQAAIKYFGGYILR